MNTSIAQATGSGQLDINGQTSPVSYVLTSNDGSVGIDVSLPRDWLLERGFRRQAVLIRENGEKTTVGLPSDLDTSHPVAVILSARSDGSDAADLGRYPEFQAAQ
ncbi:hypothetical protein [Pararhizobium sp.]|uniref:hypothetical protein n=1 Tax=Pararhizobium sp. TaxID=1977563 RepID=UPI0027188E76|nr:hypothetical protein [Pararhizobium sp.]MDO9416328.1 hypothetical protein [Pararhizobium sp.]